MTVTMMSKTPIVSKNDQDCISVLLSLKQGGSPSDTSTVVAAAAAAVTASLSSTRLNEDSCWDICNTASCGSMSTTVTASTASSSTDAGSHQTFARPFYPHSSFSRDEGNAAVTSRNQASHNIGRAKEENKYNGREPIKGPEPLNQEEEEEEEATPTTTSTISPNTVSSCFIKDTEGYASQSFFPHMQMVQQQMTRHYTGAPLSRPPPPSFYRTDMSHHSNPHPLPSNHGGGPALSSSRSWSPSFPPSFSMDRPQHPTYNNNNNNNNNYAPAPSLARPTSSSSSSSSSMSMMDRDCDSLHNNRRQGNGMSHAHKQSQLHPPLHPQQMMQTQPHHHRPMGARIATSNSSSSSLLHPLVTLSLPPFCNLDDPNILSNLIGSSSLVDPQDRQYIPDFIFLSMAQLEPCHVTPLDRIGTYKSRKVGFKGMCCKHCGGEPGFGRYFPETLRSLSQTTTTQTIVKHVAYKCRKCPKEVRDSVRALKEYQDAKDHLAKECQRSRFDERPKYGSRKVFFQRLWHRLHGGGEMVEDEDGEGKDERKALSPREESENRKGGLESKRSTALERHVSVSGSEKKHYSSPGRQRAVSYEDSDGENVPPCTVLK